MIVMKKNGKALTFLLCAALSLTLLAGCGQGGTTANQNGAPAQSQSSAAAQSTEAPQSVPPEHAAPPTQSQEALISLEEAKQIVFAELGVEESALTEQEYELDRGIYELDFTVNGMEYDYEVDARTGQILKAHSEVDNDRH